MGIYVRLKSSERISPMDWALARLDYCYGIIRYFHEGRIFVPETITVWLNAPTETLGGTKKRTIQVSNLYNDYKSLRSWLKEIFYPERLFSSVIKFEGLWDFADIKLAGFLSANNEYGWRRAYLDIEADAYGRGDLKDLTDVVWKREDTDALVFSFVTELKKITKARTIDTKEVYFSIGAPEYGEMINLRALHLQDWREFIGFLYSRLRKDEDTWIKNQVVPIARRFFLGSIRAEKIVRTISRRIQEETLLSEKEGQSVTYVARDEKSFINFYRKFKDEVFKSAAEELPQAESLKGIIKKGLERQKTLD